MQSALKRNISTFVFCMQECKRDDFIFFELFFWRCCQRGVTIIAFKNLFCQSSAVYDSVIKMPFYKLTDRVFIYRYICALDIYVFIWAQNFFKF